MIPCSCPRRPARRVQGWLALSYPVKEGGGGGGGGGAMPSLQTVTLAGLAALLAIPLPAAAQTTPACGPVPASGNPPTVTCNDPSYPNGVAYTKLAGGLILKVEPPAGGTTFSGDGDGIKIQRPIASTGEIMVDVKAGVKIGTPNGYMGSNGIDIEHSSGRPRPSNAGDISVTNAGEIHVRRTGVKIDRYSAGDITVTNSGVIVSYNPDANKLTPTIKPGGIIVRTRVGGDIKINNSGSVTSAWHAAIYAWYSQSATTTADMGSIEITSSGTVRSMVKHGILAQVDAAAVPATVTVTGGTIYGRDDGIRVTNKGTGKSTVRVSSSARIESSNEDGVHASAGDENKDESKAPVLVDVGAGAVIVTRNEGGEDDESSHGILAEHYGNQAKSGSETDTGSITVKSAGEIRTSGSGHGIAGIAHGTTALVPISIEMTGGSISAKGDGIHTENKGTGTSTVTIQGKVMGGGGDYAGVRMVGGGALVIGPKAETGATSGVAVKADGALTITMQKDDEGRVGYIMGQILNSGTTTFEGVTVGDTVISLEAGKRAIYDVEWERTAMLKAISGGYEFDVQSTRELRKYHSRARVYEALPSVLLDLNGQTSHHARMSAERDASGAWARIVAGDGEREADLSTTERGRDGRALAWDFEHWSVETGFDIPTSTEGLLLGVSAHYRDGKADVEHGGQIDVSGFGIGVSATWRGEDGWYADGQASYTRFDDIDLSSRDRGMLVSDLDGEGYALGLEIGRRMEMEGSEMTLTPRGGLVWSSVDVDGFDDVPDVPGSGWVSFGSEDSFKGRVGVLAESGDGCYFASLDVEHEFSEDRDLMASGTRLESEAESTWARLGLGFQADLDAMGQAALSGEGFYAMADGDNHDFGASATLRVSF